MFANIGEKNEHHLKVHKIYKGSSNIQDKEGKIFSVSL